MFEKQNSSTQYKDVIFFAAVESFGNKMLLKLIISASIYRVDPVRVQTLLQP